MLKFGEPIYLAIINERRLDFCPEHFQKVPFTIQGYDGGKNIENWLFENTDGRFYFGQIVTKDGKLVATVGFENHPESILFSLILDQINKPVTY